LILGELARHGRNQDLTPRNSRPDPIFTGLLPGIGRARLLADGTVVEAVLTRDDLACADGIAFFNSLRGWLDAALSQAAD